MPTRFLLCKKLLPTALLFSLPWVTSLPLRNASGVESSSASMFVVVPEFQIQSDDKAKSTDLPPPVAEPGTAPSEAKTESLKPRPSNDVLDILTTPNTAYEGIIPESASAKRAVPPAPLTGSRQWMTQNYCWQSADILYQPLYFEEVMLERHGHHRFYCLQPVVSGGKFFAHAALLPYMMVLTLPCECRYTLGHFRPGSCTPVLKDTLPWDQRAAVVQGLAVTGIAVGLPW